MDTTYCPTCGLLAEIEWREVLESTDGPVEHAKVRCVDGHWFLLPVAHLERAQLERAHVERDQPSRRIQTWGMPSSS